MTDLLTLTHEVGFSQYAPVNMDALDPLEAVRDMCKADRCGRYGKSWSCPPACSTLEQARAQIKRYSQGILVQSTAQLEDEFDYTGMTSLLEAHKKRFSTFARQARLLFPHCLHALPYLHLSGPSLSTSQAEAFFDGGLRTVRQ
mgnify:CR=1 FL=1